MILVLPEMGPDPERVCLGPVGSMWVLDFVRGRFHRTSPGDFERMFIKAEFRETRKGLGQKQQQVRWGDEPRLGCFGSLRRQRKGGLGHRVRGLVLDAAHCSLVASCLESLRV